MSNKEFGSAVARAVALRLVEPKTIGYVPAVFFDTDRNKIIIPRAFPDGSDFTCALPDQVASNIDDAAQAIVIELRRARGT